MSEQALRIHKSTNRTTYNKSSQSRLPYNNAMTLTRIMNPLAAKIPSTKQRQLSIVNKGQNVVKENYDRRNFSIASSGVDIKQNNKTRQEQLVNKKYKVEEKNYRFYADLLNNSSDDSFVMDQSMRDSRKATREQQIANKFQNSRQQIEQLLKRSRQRRDTHEINKQTNINNQNPTKNISNDRQSKRQQIRQKLQYYHCDSIIIKPLNHPVKVFEFSINPTTTANPPKKGNDYDRRLMALEQSFQDCSKYASVKKNQRQMMMESFGESPLDKLNQSSLRDVEMDEPSFLKESIKKANNHYDSRKDKKHSQKPFLNNPPKSKSQITNPPYDNFDTLSNASHNSKALSNHQSTTPTYPYSNNQQPQQTPLHSFKKRNKIFANQKKYGLKLSRAIRHQEQLEKLQGELGIDVFHIVIEEEELLRQCCT